MTVRRLMDGLAGRPGNGPSVPTAFTGAFQAGLIFGVSAGGQWFSGFWWWVPPGGDTGPQKFCLYRVVTNTTAAAAIIPAATVMSGPLTAGAWNLIPAPAPLQLSPGAAGNIAGGLFIVTTAWTSVHGFPDTGNQFGTGNPYASGISNGPLFTFGASNTGHGFGAGSVFGTATADPATACPVATDGTFDNFWLDVQVSDTAPDGYAGSYRLWPNRGDASQPSTADSAVDYVVATEIALAQACTLNRIWYYSPSGTAQLATRAGLYTIAGPASGAEAAVIASPAWSGAAASGWVSASFPAGVTLGAGKYKAYIYNSAASPDGWSPKDAGSDYWQSGEGAAGLSWGPLSAPNLAGSSPAWNFNGSLPGSTPPFQDGQLAHGQPTFAMTGGSGGTAQYPYLWAGVGTGSTQTQNYWVDLEVTPLAVTAAAVASSGGFTRQAMRYAPPIPAGAAQAWQDVSSGPSPGPWQRVSSRGSR